MITGTATATLPGMNASASGISGAQGSAIVTLPSLTGSASGSHLGATAVLLVGIG